MLRVGGIQEGDRMVMDFEKAIEVIMDMGNMVRNLLLFVLDSSFKKLILLLGGGYDTFTGK